MYTIKNYIFYLLVFIFCISNLNASSNINLNKITINLENTQSLQRGAKVFFDQCQGCHGLKYMRYSDLAIGLKLNEQKDKGLEQLIKEKFMHSIDGINDNNYILSPMYKENAIKWFGKIPPDLSLISRYKGTNWLFTYMKSFYKDPARPFGVNNLLFPDVGMPHILLKYQGIQILKHDQHSDKIEDLLELIENGELSEDEYNAMITDLATFLSYIGEPIQVERKNIGTFVLIFLIILTIVLYMLKKEFWSDIK
ncbi:Ammonia monooxygenase gamma subunit [Candidatus Azoamicus ciliaticola]|uniref:Ammonia monooxygenase gamma subunit n=1 Tax=Candidatus Azoamicus ciliaticola TaxID=2652803 RepID=A0A6J5JZ99_9GAMM|nr:Ammonia monooxygenase gamma subunit [Candidatus Azoamicus ciliaticola]